MTKYIDYTSLPRDRPLTVDEYLEQHPWPEQWASLARSVDFLWHHDLEATTEQLWPYISDTSTTNQLLNLPEMTYEERDGKLYGRANYMGLLHEWEEVPWQWQYHRSLQAARIYSRGALRYIRTHFFFQPLSETTTRLYIYFGWIPRYGWMRWLLKIQGSQIDQAYCRILPEMVEEIRANPQSTGETELYLPPIPEVDIDLSEEKVALLDQIRNQLVDRGVEPYLIERVYEHITSAPEDHLYRIRPKALAHQWELPLQDLLKIFLHGSRAGLFNFTWDVICPHCRGTRQELNHLGDISNRGDCDVCDIDFDTTGLNSLEVTFHLNPNVRKIEKKWFCAAEPATKPHIRLQVHLAPSEKRTIFTLLDSGRYRARIQGDKQYRILDVSLQSQTRSITWTDSDSSHQWNVAPLPEVELVNNSDGDRTFIIEQVKFDALALRPADLFNFQEFRDLFSKESVSTDLQLDVGVQTILFTDVVGSTRYYEEVGDAEAFAEIRRHFVEVFETVSRHDGAVVKTIGDAVMAAFTEPGKALAAAVDMQKYFHPDNDKTHLRLRISLHRGPCLAVNLNTNIDYFGRTVNFAAKLQGDVESGQIILSQEVREDPAVERFLERLEYPVEDIEFDFSSMGTKLTAHRFEVR